jgi:CHAT domain-containing protein/tetratricopeptide (TPR) repeat protein
VWLQGVDGVSRATQRYVLVIAALLFLFCFAAAHAQNLEEQLQAARTIYFEQGPDQALPLIQQLLGQAQKAGDRKHEAIALGLIGNCYKRLGDYPKALEYLTKALELKRALHDRLEEGKSLSHLGLLLWEMGEYEKAIEDFRESINIGQELGNKELEGSAVNNLGLVYDELGDYSRSLAQYQRALELNRQSGFERAEADTLGNIGGVYLNRGRFNDAIPYYQQSLLIDQRLRLKAGASQDLGNIGLCQLGLGKLDLALASFDQALRLAREAGLDKEQADWHKGKGFVLARQAKFDLARGELGAAIVDYEKGGLKRELVEALEARATLFADLGDFVTAEQDFTRAMDVARTIGYSRGLSDSLAALGALEIRRGRVPQAVALYTQALQRARQGGERDIEAAALVLLAEAMCAQGQTDEAMRDGKQAAEIAHATGATLTEAEAQYWRAEALLKSGHQTDALQQYEATQPMVHEAGAPDLEWRIQFGRGRALEVLGQDQDAVDAYKASVELIEGVRAQLQEERFRSGYFQDKSEVYVRLVRLLIKLSRPKDAFSYSERLRADQYHELLQGAAEAGADAREVDLRARIRHLQRALDEQQGQSKLRGSASSPLKQELYQAEREYQNLLDDLRARSSSGEITALAVPSSEQLQLELPSNAALVEYVVGDDTVSELIIRRTGVWATTIPVRIADLEAKVELMRDLIGRLNDDSWSMPAASLRELLITPAERAGELQGVKRLLLVPNGVLNYLPFAALARTASEAKRVLVQEYTLSYLPAAASLRPDAATVPLNGLLAMAPVPGRLRYTREEVENVSEYFSSPRVLLVGHTATKTALQRWSATSHYIHLATHSSFNKLNPLLSSLELEGANQDGGRLEVHEILGMHIPAELVTLSACETALGSGYFSVVPAGDEFVGLTRAFLRAGSAAVMSSLWEVNDHSTAVFMSSFYRGLKVHDRAEALALAQRAMIRPGSAWRHPYYWASFVLTDTTLTSAPDISRKNADLARVSKTDSAGGR